jgi:hypothetical protein
VCVCVCVRERERERESACVCDCLNECVTHVVGIYYHQIIYNPIGWMGCAAHTLIKRVKRAWSLSSSSKTVIVQRGAPPGCTPPSACHNRDTIEVGEKMGVCSVSAHRLVNLIKYMRDGTTRRRRRRRNGALPSPFSLFPQAYPPIDPPSSPPLWTHPLHRHLLLLPLVITAAAAAAAAAVVGGVALQDGGRRDALQATPHHL